MSAKPRFSLLILILSFILINSCDDNIITFDSNNSEINYYEQSFTLNLEKSSFQIVPTYLEQGLNPKLYIGNISDFDEENLSYALFQFNPDIINNYNI